MGKETIIAAMVIRQAAEILDSNMFEYTCKAGITKESMKAEILALIPAAAEAELEALTKIAKRYQILHEHFKFADHTGPSAVRHALDEKGE